MGGVSGDEKRPRISRRFRRDFSLDLAFLTIAFFP